jgi:hypothetical protein
LFRLGCIDRRVHLCNVNMCMFRQFDFRHFDVLTFGCFNNLIFDIWMFRQFDFQHFDVSTIWFLTFGCFDNLIFDILSFHIANRNATWLEKPWRLALKFDAMYVKPDLHEQQKSDRLLLSDRQR